MGNSTDVSDSSKSQEDKNKPATTNVFLDKCDNLTKIKQSEVHHEIEKEQKGQKRQDLKQNQQKEEDVKIDYVKKKDGKKKKERNVDKKRKEQTEEENKDHDE